MACGGLIHDLRDPVSSENSMVHAYRDAIVVDGLNVSNWDSDAVYDSLSAGGVTAINATIATWEGFLETVDHLARWDARFRERADTIAPIGTADDILAAKRDGKTGIIFGFQNASPIEDRIDRLALFHRLGVRIIQITYHERNLLGDGCYERVPGGLTHFGAEAVAEMNRLGILIDLSHVGDRTTLDVIDASEKPVSVTHANARPYYDVPRNKTDEAVRRLAERGGVVGATCIVTFLKTGASSTLPDYVDAIDDLVQRIGIDHVAIGTDFTQDQTPDFWRYIGSQQGSKFPAPYINRTDRPDRRPLYPRGLETPDKLPALAAALSDRGYTWEDVEKLLGGNWMRLFHEVWQP